MKLEFWVRKNGKEVIEKSWIGKDFKAIRCYFESSKAAFVDYKKNRYFENQYRKNGIELEVWQPRFADGAEIMYRLVRG